jgi:protein TonB
MTGAALSPPSVFSPAPVARFGVALAASAFAHWMLLAAPVSHLARQGMAPIPDNAPMTVRLAPAPVLVPEVPAPEKWGQTRFSASVSQQGQKVESDPVLKVESDPVLPPVLPDLNYYPARDLDDYPRPLAPLRIDRPGHAGAGEVRLELLIDERGVVRDVAFAGPARPGAEEEKLRAALAATPFAPARKDGRPVRSRILLRLTGTHTFSVPRNLREDDDH